MKIAVVGAGGVGGYFGGRLAAAGGDVTFIVRGATLAALKRDGLRVDSINGNINLPDVKATDNPADVGPVDVVLVATKAWQLPDVAVNAKPLIGHDTIVVPLQNGIDAPEQLAPLGHVAGGLCAIVSFLVAPGHIRHAASEPIVMFGELDNSPSPTLEKLRDAFVSADVKCEIPRDIRHSMWTKFIFIAPLSGMGAVTRVPIGEWRTIPETRALAEQAVREVVAVGRAQGVVIDDEIIPVTMGRYDTLDPSATASLQRDVMDGKPSELDAQLGAVVRLGRAAGVPTPLCDWMYHSLLPGEKRARAGMT